MAKKKFFTIIIVLVILIALFLIFLISKFFLVERISVKFKRGYQVLGFLPYWTVVKNLSINYDLLDQIIYFSFDFNENGELSYFDKTQEQTPVNIFNGTKFDEVYHEARIHNTKILVAITCFDRDLLSGVLINEEKVNRLTDQIVELIRLRNLDGVNLDFEFETGASEISPDDFTGFVRILTEKLKTYNKQTILSADFYADAEINDYPYDFTGLNEYLDQFLVMTYDYHRRASENAGPVSPLKWTNPDFDYDVQRTIDYYLSFIPAEKLLMGIPFYGYSWQTQTEDFNSESLWGSGKTVLYKDIENLIAETGSEIYFDPESASCWIVYIDEEGNINQVYFDNPYSLGKKADFLRGKKLTGAFIWALGYEGDQVQLWNVFMR